MITKLEANEIFVFGSNLAGRHGRGAALTARNNFGAKYGKGSGFCGQSYAIPTKDWDIKTLPIKRIEHFVNEFMKFATCRPELTFIVTKIGCGLAGFSVSDIAPLFNSAMNIENIQLPIEFIKHNKKQKGVRELKNSFSGHYANNEIMVEGVIPDKIINILPEYVSIDEKLYRGIKRGKDKDGVSWTTDLDTAEAIAGKDGEVISIDVIDFIKRYNFVAMDRIDEYLTDLGMADESYVSESEIIILSDKFNTTQYA